MVLIGLSMRLFGGLYVTNVFPFEDKCHYHDGLYTVRILTRILLANGAASEVAGSS